MCWNIQVSLLAGFWGMGVSLYLARRNYSIRDRWYALFLAAFTSLQFFDAWYWYLKGEDDEIPCTMSNYAISKYLIPPVGQ